MLKNGDRAISTVTRRTPKGLELTVRLHPAVEEFFRAAAGDEYTPVELFGRKWITPVRLNVYEIPPSMEGSTMISGTTAFRMDRVGTDLFFVDHQSGLKTVNMSFVRLVGASALEDGLTFAVAGAYERDDLNWFAASVTEAGNIICKKYVYPMIISTNNIVRLPEVGGGIQEGGN